MADLDQMKRALRRAHEAGDAQAARRFAQMIKREEAPGVIEDIAKAVPSGFARGVAGLASIPSILEYGAGQAASVPGRVYNRVAGDGTWSEPEFARRGRESAAESLGGRPMPSYGDIVGGIESVTGELYEPQTRTGKFAGTAAEFAAGFPFTSGSAAQRTAQLMVPAFASEAAGQATEGTAFEPYARLGGALLAAGGVGVQQARSGGRRIAAEALEEIGADDIMRASVLMREAKQLPNGGVTLTFDEALNQVTGGRAGNLSQVRRVAEYGGGRGSARLANVRSGRAAEVERAGGAAIDDIAPTPYAPDRAAQKAQSAAGGAIKDIERRRTDAVNPFYQRAASDTVPEQAFASALDDIDSVVSRNPMPQATAGARRLRSLVDQEGARNVGRLDDIYKGVRDVYAGELPFTATPAQQTSARVTREALNSLDSALRQSSQNLARGRELYSRISDRVVTPARQGPLGRIASSDPGGSNASAQMGRTLAGAGESNRYHTVVGQATRRLVRQDPRAAETVARDYIADVFTRNTRDLQGGANAYGGANFRSKLIGNSADERNLKALVTNLPQGAQRWRGFEKLMEVMEATGRAPRKGSDTAFNQAIQKNMSGAGAPLSRAFEETSQIGLGLRQAISDKWMGYRMGRNTAELADLLTDPAAAPLLAELARSPANSARGNTIALRLLYMTDRAATQPKPVE